mgnify:CR=1 FL=1
MRIIAANTYPLIVRFPGSPGITGILIAKCDMVMHEITDRLDPAPAGRSLAKEVPRHLGKVLGVAVTASQQEKQRFFRQFLDRMLLRRKRDDVGLTRVSDHRRARYPELPGRGDEACAPVIEAIGF